MKTVLNVARKTAPVTVRIAHLGYFAGVFLHQYEVYGWAAGILLVLEAGVWALGGEHA